MNEICYNSEGEAYYCSSSKSSILWFSGMAALLLFEGIVAFVLGIVVKSLFGYNIYDFKKRQNVVILGGGLLFVLASIFFYVRKRGFEGIGARHMGIGKVKLRKIRLKQNKAKWSEYYANQDRRAQEAISAGESNVTIGKGASKHNAIEIKIAEIQDQDVKGYLV